MSASTPQGDCSTRSKTPRYHVCSTSRMGSFFVVSDRTESPKAALELRSLRNVRYHSMKPATVSSTTGLSEIDASRRPTRSLRSSRSRYIPIRCSSSASLVGKWYMTAPFVKPVRDARCAKVSRLAPSSMRICIAASVIDSIVSRPCRLLLRARPRLIVRCVSGPRSQSLLPVVSVAMGSPPNCNNFDRI